MQLASTAGIPSKPSPHLPETPFARSSLQCSSLEEHPLGRALTTPLTPHIPVPSSASCRLQNPPQRNTTSPPQFWWLHLPAAVGTFPALGFTFWTTWKSQSLKTCISKRFKAPRYLRWNLNAQKKPLWVKKNILNKNRTKKTKKDAKRAYVLMEDTRAKQTVLTYLSMYFFRYLRWILVIFFHKTMMVNLSFLTDLTINTITEIHRQGKWLF